MVFFFRTTFILHICLLINCLGFAQHSLLQLHKVTYFNNYVATYEAFVQPATYYTILPGAAATSLVLRSQTHQDFNGAYIISRNDTLRMTEDIHVREENGLPGSSSNLIIFNHTQTQFSFYSGTVSGKVTFYLLNTGKAAVNSRRGATDQTAEACTKPPTIDQDVWRAGLPAPVQAPDATQPKHLIVHHAASSNTLTDYTYVVRNIYLQHTQINKWNDIGYNFLIAQDGTIFQGRDGRNNIEDDNVLGAHFCGKNTNTMGVCLLGNYTSIPPTEKTLASLVALLSWKAIKENLNPLGTSIHPQNSASGTLLDVIAGHRDGCSTECPGNLTYALLPQIRQQVNDQINACTEETSPEIVVYPQPGNEKIVVKVSPGNSIRQLRFFDITGKAISPDYKKISTREIQIDTYPLAAGLYVMQIYFENESSYTHKLLVLK